jgi:Fic family protein
MNRGQNKIVYTPPRGKKVITEKFKELENFINSESGLDPLIIMALAHYQFEAIHPYTDGNGRTGRILNLMILMLKELLDTPVLFLSKFILENRKEYYHRLKMVTEKDEWTGFIIFMLDGVRDTSLSTIVKIHSMVRLFEESLDKAKKELPGHIYSKELIEAIFRQPYCRIQFLVESDIAKRQTASIYLRELEKIGMLSSDTRGRERIYKNSKLIAAISN